MNKLERSVVRVVDDDNAVRDSIAFLLKSVGIDSECYANADDFLEHDDPGVPGCIVLDIRMPGMSGLELQRELNQRGSRTPVIFITGHGDITMAVQAMRNGAADFVQKPFRDQSLLDSVNAALQSANAVRNEVEQLKSLRKRYENLTAREKEVMELVAVGTANKVIALDLGASQRTIEIHRARVMEKMAARNLAQLVRMHILL